MREAENIRRKYCPELFEWLGEVSDPRHQSYITYGMKEILGVVYYKGLMGLESMRSVNESFEDLAATKNIYHYLGEEIKDFLPHYQTVNDLLCRIRSEEIEAIIQKIIYQFIRRKSFDHAKFQKKWLVIIDGTELYSGRRRINEHCLKRRYKKERLKNM